MSDFITNVTGKEEAFYANAPAWHKKGQVVRGTKNAEEALELANLNWEVEKRKLYYKANNNNNIVIPDVAIVRKDAEIHLGTVTDRYRIVQNTDAFKFLDSLLLEGGLEYESAGSLKNGEYTWLLAKFPEDYKMAEDELIKKYILLVNSYNGKKSLSILPTDVRVVCWNTMSYALGMNEERIIVRHIGNTELKLDEAREMLGILDSTNQQVNNIYEEMANKQSTEEVTVGLLDKLFPISRENKSITRINNIRSKVLQNFNAMNTSVTNNTVFGLFNAVTEYTDHQRLKESFQSNLVGTGYKLKLDAFNYCKLV